MKKKYFTEEEKKEANKAQCKKQYEKNKEKRKEYARLKRIGKEEIIKEYNQKWVEKNPEYETIRYEKLKEKNPNHAKEKSKKHRVEKPNYQSEYNKTEKRKDYILKYLFGISLEIYTKMLNEQKGCCEICGKHESEFKRRLFVDHNHTTEKVRGLLCHNCNTLLGNSKEEIKTLDKAILYLKKYN